MTRNRIPNVINVIAGVWLLLSPWILGFGNTYALSPNNVFWGIVVALLAASRLWWHQGAWASWTDFVLGVWIVSSPYILGTDSQRFIINNLIVGLVVIAMSLWSAIVSPRVVSGQSFSSAIPTDRDVAERDVRERDMRDRDFREPIGRPLDDRDLDR